MFFCSSLVSLSVEECPEEDYPGIPYVCDENGQNLTVEVCGLEIPGVDCDDCCFEIEYCRRYIPPQNGAASRFDVRLEKINITGPSGLCYECGLEYYDEIVEAAHKKIIVQDEAYHDIPLAGSNNHHLVMKAPCVYEHSMGFGLCEDLLCCYKIYSIAYDDVDNEVDSYGGGSTSYLYDSLYYPNYSQRRECDNDECQPKCGYIEGLLPPGYCEVPCDDEEWETGDYITLDFPNCPGCTLTINYNIRESECLHNWRDVRINDIDYDANLCFPCLTGPEHALLFASQYLFTHPQIFPSELGFGECDEYFRSFFENCWNGITMPEPCGDDTCCITRWKICKDGSGNFLDPEPITPHIFIADECETPGCEPLCKTFWSIITPNERSPDIDRRDVGEIIELFLSPNPAQNTLALTLKSKIDAGAEFVVTNLGGQNILNENLRLKSGENSFTFDLGELSTGLYFYRFEIPGEEVVTGAFFVEG